MTESATTEFDQLVSLFEQTHQTLQRQAARSVDTALVVRNWLFGYYLIEYENAGDRAKSQGKAITHRLSASLAQRGLKGVSPTNLKKFRSFFESYQDIRQTASVGHWASHEPGGRQTASVGPGDDSQSNILQTSVGSGAGSDPELRQVASVASSLLHRSDPKVIETVAMRLAARFQLSWSHYVTLLTLSDVDERRFYEIEAVAGSWGVRELERQISSRLYERLALSRDKDELRKLAEQGLVVEQAADLIKNPYVLEFLGLEEQSQYSEHELETAIIDKLETFGKNDALVELTLPEGANIYASEYQLYLPSKEELRQKLIAWRKQVEG